MCMFFEIESTRIKQDEVDSMEIGCDLIIMQVPLMNFPSKDVRPNWLLSI